MWQLGYLENTLKSAPCVCTTGVNKYQCTRCRAITYVPLIRAEVHRMHLAILNQGGDDLCWIEVKEQAKALPESEFMESCRRYRKQITEERGEETRCMTIAELEKEIERLTSLHIELVLK